MTIHNHHTPQPAAVPSAALAQIGPVTLALRAMRSAVTTPPATGPVTDAIRTMRAADPAFDCSPELRALRRALADRIEADLAALDALGGDADLEDGADAEPSLCGLTVSWPSAGGDDREEVNEDGGDLSYARKAPRPKREPTEYILNVRGDCCAPIHPHGSQVLCSTAAPAPGDFVAIHFRPATAERLGFAAWLKRLVFMNAPGGRGNIEPCVCVEQLNPPKTYVIPWSDVDVVHRVTGPKPATVRGVKMTSAERAQFHQTWIRGVSVEVVK